MFCTNCGKEIPDDSAFCTFCGQKVEAEQKKRKADIIGGSLRKRSKPSIKMALGIGGAAVLAVAGISFAVARSNPKTIVTEGIQKTWKAICKEETGLGAYLGRKQLIKLLETGKTRQEISGNMSASILGLRLDNAQVHVQIDKNGGKELSAAAEAVIEGQELGEGLLYRNEDAIYVSAPELIDGSFYLEPAQLEEKLENSGYRAELLNTYGLYVPEEMEINHDQLAKKLKDALKEDWSKLYENMKVEKTQEKSFSVGGKQTKCQGYEITIQKEDLKDVLEAASDAVVPEIINSRPIFVHDYSGQELLDGGVSSNGEVSEDSVREIEQEYERAIKTIQQVVKQCLSLIKSDQVFNVYIGPKGRIVAAEAEWEIPQEILAPLAAFEGMEIPAGIEESLGTVSGRLEFLGSKNPLDNAKAEGSLNLGGLVSCTVGVERKMNDTKEELQDSAKIFWTASGLIGMLSENAEVEGRLNKETGEWKLETSLSGSDGLSVGGTFSDVKKGKGFCLTIDDINQNLRILGFYLGTSETDFSYRIGPLKEDIENEMETDESRNVLEMSADEWKAIFKEITERQ